MQDRNQILEQLFAKTTRGIKLGLERMQNAAALHGNPQNAFKSIHVAGTNGKGSVCAYIESALRACGNKTALFTSPHAVHFEERLVIDGKPVEESEWMQVYSDLEQTIERFELTFFEAITLLAFELFKRRQVDWAIIETGLGGRLDATNIIVPQICIITSIGIDHTEYLGNTIKSIAAEKLGIVKSGIPLVLSQPADESVLKCAEQVCNRQNAQLIISRQENISGIVRNTQGTRFSYNCTQYFIPFYGIYQPLNAACAIDALRLLNCSTAVREGLRKAYLPGRFEIKTIGGKKVVFDVGHNAQAAKGFADTAKAVFADERLCLIVGIMKDKDIAAMMRQYCAVASDIIAVQPATSRASSPDELLAQIPEGFDGGAQSDNNLAAAVTKAVEEYDGIIGIVGSFYTVGEAMSALGIAPYLN